MSSSKKLDDLIAALQVMPGIGPVSATRIAYYLLDHRRADGLRLSSVLKDSLEAIALCPDCRNYSDGGAERCALCSDSHRRESGLLCVVESPMDVEAFEHAGSFSGTYFVLHGHLSPIDGIGPEELGLGVLKQRLESGTVSELILAVSQSVDGDATAEYLAAMARRQGVKVSRLATGVPIGGDIQSLDSGTLASSLQFRRQL